MEKSSATTSAIINFAENLEESSALFYEDLAKKHEAAKDIFIAFSKESKTNKIFLSRTYRETITDALEACFSFDGITVPNLDIPEIIESASYSEHLKSAIMLESNAVQFYSIVLNCSKDLLSTIASSFERVVQKRKKRKQKLESMF